MLDILATANQAAATYAEDLDREFEARDNSEDSVGRRLQPLADPSPLDENWTTVGNAARSVVSKLAASFLPPEAQNRARNAAPGLPDSTAPCVDLSSLPE